MEKVFHRNSQIKLDRSIPYMHLCEKKQTSICMKWYFKEKSRKWDSKPAVFVTSEQALPFLTAGYNYQNFDGRHSLFCDVAQDDRLTSGDQKRCWPKFCPVPEVPPRGSLCANLENTQPARSLGSSGKDKPYQMGPAWH